MAESTRPSPQDCHKAIKILQQYKRLAQKYQLRLADKRIIELDNLREHGLITINHLPAKLRAEFPEGIFGALTLAEIYRWCGV